MARRIVIVSWMLVIGSLLLSQSMMKRLRVPISINGELGLGYDNNFLRLSDKEIKNDNVKEYGITSTLDSPIFKPSVKLIEFDVAIIIIIIKGIYKNFISSKPFAIKGKDMLECGIFN